MESVLMQLKARRTVLLARHTWICFHLTFICAVLVYKSQLVMFFKVEWWQLIFITVIIKTREITIKLHTALLFLLFIGRWMKEKFPQRNVILLWAVLFVTFPCIQCASLFCPNKCTVAPLSHLMFPWYLIAFWENVVPKPY